MMRDTTEQPLMYARDVQAKATIGEAQQLVRRAVIPAFIAARFALILALLSFVLSATAIALAARR